ncbi:uncharacterized protein LOC130376106 isoform X4 [Gadus chalcogrammus]|uniref:uncharacterized protein LOC130376106 isoform X4 n=1 Tax=Gadus chalcogrammus TaxID=1042646 RepID=UPI0024C47C6D|nr:uncharacterized protein LOC130376106 isoform X4 [Gadus chalcogrammus]
MKRARKDQEVKGDPRALTGGTADLATPALLGPQDPLASAETLLLSMITTKALILVPAPWARKDQEVKGDPRALTGGTADLATPALLGPQDPLASAETLLLSMITTKALILVPAPWARKDQEVKGDPRALTGGTADLATPALLGPQDPLASAETLLLSMITTKALILVPAPW